MFPRETGFILVMHIIRVIPMVRHGMELIYSHCGFLTVLVQAVYITLHKGLYRIHGYTCGAQMAK
jgi:hypothetical protein